ncbi:MAG: hypothetical protein C0621_07370 [Desulfuromonas sp.]|nr:MAG: hypothetical protein C0621_07370 [Desulfuromonas sp.]
MHQRSEELQLLRIFVGESDRFGRRLLYEALVDLCRREGLAGATVLKGAMGFGAGSILHSDRYLRLSSDLPVVIEVVDRAEKIEVILPQLERMLSGGLVTLETVQAIRYPAPEL